MQQQIVVFAAVFGFSISLQCVLKFECMLCLERLFASFSERKRFYVFASTGATKQGPNFRKIRRWS